MVALAGAVLLCAFATPVLAEDEVSEAKAEKLFRSAFDKKAMPYERFAALSSVVKRHKKSKWADDALWTLSQWELRRKHINHAMRLMTNLADSFPRCELEEFTMYQDVYRQSRIPRVLHMIKVSGYGHIGVGADGKVITLNPVPMVLYEDLARLWLAKKHYRNSLKYYELALQYGPVGGFYKKTLVNRVKEAKERLKRHEEKLRTFGIDPKDEDLPKIDESKDDMGVMSEDESLTLQQLLPKTEVIKPVKPKPKKGDDVEGDKNEAEEEAEPQDGKKDKTEE